MMKAAISGRSAAAVVLDGTAWFRIDGEEPSVVKPAGPHDWPFVFGAAEDIQYVETDTVEDVVRLLTTAMDENQALTLVLICLDMGSEFQTKIEAASHLEVILSRTESASGFLWRILTGKPLPCDASIADGYDASVNTDTVRAFFDRLREVQPSVAIANEAFEMVPDDVFGRVSRDDVRSFAIHSGIWRECVDAAADGRRPTLRENVNLPPEWAAAQIEQALRSWYEGVAVRASARSQIRVIAPAPRLDAKPIQEERTLFAATDADMEALQPIDFHGSLINNLLLRRRLVVPDLYFFTSRGIAAHLANRDTLLEHAIASGLVVAASRYRGADFETTYKIMRRQRIVSRPCAHVGRLQRAADRNEAGTYLYWPIEGVSTAYERYLSVLEADAPPAAALHAASESALVKDWNLTRDWRTSLIDRAREATLRHGGTGVHKRELFHQLVKAVVGQPTAEITGIGKLLGVAKELTHKIRTFWSWAAEGHRFSRAQMLDALIYSPGYEKVRNLFVTSALGALSTSKPLHVEVDLPSTAALKELPPSRIIELRKGPGADYFAAIDLCRQRPNERERVRNAIEQYAGEVLKVCSQQAGRIEVKRVEFSVGLPSASADEETARRQQFLAMTTFDSFPGKLYDRYRPGGKIGPVTINKQTDVCVTNDLPESGVERL